MNERLADELSRLCCAETEGKLAQGTEQVVGHEAHRAGGGMSLFRRGMRRPRNPEPSPEFLSQIAAMLKDMTLEQTAALPDVIKETERRFIKQMEMIMHTLEDLLAAVKAERTQIDSLVALTHGLYQKVVEAIGTDALTPSQQMRLEAVFSEVSDSADEVAAAIKENTVEATAGAVTGGQSFGEINSGAASGAPINQPPAPPPSTGPMTDSAGDTVAKDPAVT